MGRLYIRHIKTCCESEEFKWDFKRFEKISILTWYYT